MPPSVRQEGCTGRSKGCFYSVQLVRLSESDEWAILGRKKLSFQGVVGRIRTEENRSGARNTLWQGEGCSRRGSSGGGPNSCKEKAKQQVIDLGPTGKGLLSTSACLVEMDSLLGIAS